MSNNKPNVPATTFRAVTANAESNHEKVIALQKATILPCPTVWNGVKDFSEDTVVNTRIVDRKAYGDMVNGMLGCYKVALFDSILDKQAQNDAFWLGKAIIGAILPETYKDDVGRINTYVKAYLACNVSTMKNAPDSVRAAWNRQRKLCNWAKLPKEEKATKTCPVHDPIKDIKAICTFAGLAEGDLKSYADITVDVALRALDSLDKTLKANRDMHQAPMREVINDKRFRLTFERALYNAVNNAPILKAAQVEARKSREKLERIGIKSDFDQFMAKVQEQAQAQRAKDEEARRMAEAQKAEDERSVRSGAHDDDATEATIVDKPGIPSLTRQEAEKDNADKRINPDAQPVQQKTTRKGKAQK